MDDPQEQPESCTKTAIRPLVCFSGLLTAGAAVAAVASIAGFFGRFAWWMDLTSHFRVQYMLLFVLLATACAIIKNKRLFWAAVILVIVNSIPVATHLLPIAEKSPASAGTPIRAMLINVNTLLGDPEQVKAEIIRQDPDILILEEISDEWTNKLSSVTDRYPHRAVDARDDNFGIGLFCRASCKAIDIDYIGNGGVPSAIAELTVDGTNFTVVATHPVPPVNKQYSAWRNNQLEELSKRIIAIAGPVVLMGDLNTTPWSYHYGKLVKTAGLKSSSEGRDIRPTWPTFCPPLWITIDHCLHSEGIVILDRTIGKSVGSDHWPLTVEFALRTAEQ
jgi:endonuclease/exonuclease/phosphatase (EEP) superfamily protein YafD